jgi:hypothetical protein
MCVERRVYPRQAVALFDHCLHYTGMLISQAGYCCTTTTIDDSSPVLQGDIYPLRPCCIWVILSQRPVEHSRRLAVRWAIEGGHGFWKALEPILAHCCYSWDSIEY